MRRAIACLPTHLFRLKPKRWRLAIKSLLAGRVMKTPNSADIGNRRDATSVFTGGSTARLFFLGMTAFFIQSSALARTGWTRCFSSLWGGLTLEQHLNEFLPNISKIPSLITITFAVQYDISFAVDPIAVPGKKPSPPSRFQVMAAMGIPSQGNFRIHFVDVLSTGTTTAGGGDAKFAVSDGQS